MIEGNMVLAVIPARSGSKGLPNKNIRMLNGKPLLQHSVEHAVAVKYIDCIVVTTDSNYYLKLIEAVKDIRIYPLLRPTKLATDETPMLPVILHALENADKKAKTRFDFIVLLQPTCPLRAPEDISRCLEMLVSCPEADSVISFVEAGDYHPARMKRIDENGWVYDFCVEEIEGTRRQDLKPAYHRNGAIYCYRRETLTNQRSIWGKKIKPYLMPLERSVNIDNIIDFMVAQAIIEKNKYREV